MFADRRPLHLAWVRALAVLAALCLACPAAAQPGKEGDKEVIEDDPPKPAPKGDGNSDIETIEDDAPTTTGTPKPAEPKPEPPPVDKFEFRGFTRIIVGAGIAGSEILPPGAPTEERVGYDRGLATQYGYVDFRYSRGDYFQAIVSGSLQYGAYVTENRPGTEDGSRAVEFGLIEPVLREAYIGIFLKRFDFRLGQQRIVWGNSDGITPNDVLNARDQRSRLQFDSEMMHLPTLAARADFDLGLASLGIVAQPFFTPDQFSLYGSNWSLVQPDGSRTFRKLFGLLSAGRDRTVLEGIQNILVGSRTPRSAFDAGSLGASLKFKFGGVDTSYYYLYGFERTPFTYLDPQLAAQLDTSDLNNVNGAVLDAFVKQLNSASETYGGPLVINYLRRHHVGADAATTIGPLVVRVDVAYDSIAAFFARETLNSVARPQAQGVLGLQYGTGDLNNIVLLEASYARIFGLDVPLVPVLNQANSGPLLFVQENNVGFSNLIRWSFFEHLVIETRTFISAVPFWYQVRPEIGYGGPSFTARVGALIIDGSGGSFGGYYRRNDTVYLTTRYAF